MDRVPVSLKEKSYEVLIAAGLMQNSGDLLAEAISPCRAAIITDDNVAPIYLNTVRGSLEAAGFRTSALVLPHGEKTKCLDSVARIYAFLSESGITRSDAVIALGGGVVGDTGGFASSTWLRGVRYVQIPTSLLAQVDSSVGGKTAIDLPQGKNLAGAFHQPSLVLCDPAALETLPEHYWLDGLGEVVKYGAILDEALFALLEETADGGRRAVMENMIGILHHCVACKAEIVSRDEHDNGERMLLNFGHTLGHAVEVCQHYEGLSHGMAVAAGMTAITRWSEQQGLTEPGTSVRLTALLDRLGLPTALPALDRASMLHAMSRDKKKGSSGSRIVILDRIGKSRVMTVQEDCLEMLLAGLR